MKYKIFKDIVEYANHTEHSYDLYVCFFYLHKKPNHNIPILRVITSNEDACKFGYSSYAVTFGFKVNNFPYCDELTLDQFIIDYLSGKYESVYIPSNFTALKISVSISDIIQSRNNICLNCPLMVDNTCLACGCNIFDRTKLLTSSCPDLPPKWIAYVDKNLKSRVITTTKKSECIPCKGKSNNVNI